MEMKEDILKQPVKVGNIGEADEAVIMIPMMTIKDLRAVVVETQVVVKAGDGMATRKAILRHREKAGSIAVVEEVLVMTTMTIIKHPHVVAVAEAGTMMMTIIKHLHAAEEAVTMTTTKTIIKALRGDVADGMTMMIIKGLQAVVAEARVVAKAVDGMAMKKNIPVRPWKVGSIGAEDEGAAMIMMTMTIIKDHHAVVAEVHA